MKRYAIALFVLASLVGCSSSSEDVASTPSKPGEGKPLNPSGTQTSSEQAMAQQMGDAGKAQGSAQAEAAQKMAEAMKKGGKP